MKRGDNHKMNSNLARELIAIIEPDGGYALDWQYPDQNGAKAGTECEANWYEMYRADRDTALFLWGTTPKPEGLSASVEYLYLIAASFVKVLVRNPDLDTLRNQAVAELEDEALETLLAGAPYLNGAEYLDRHWLERVWERLNQASATMLKTYQGSATEYFIKQNPQLHLAGKVYFHLVESKREEFPFAFLATYAAEPSATGKAKHLPLQNALLEYGQNSQKLLKLLATVNQVAGQSALIAELVESGEIFHPVGLNADEAYTFLKEVPLYEAAGILCRIPNWWRKKADSLKVTVNIGAKPPVRVGLDALVDFDVQLALGEESLTVAELKQLLAASEGLAFLKGRWVEVDHQRLQETLAAYEQARRLAHKGDLTLMEAMRLRLATSKTLNRMEEHCKVEVNNGDWLENVLAQLKRPETIPPVVCGPDFKAVLREYQKRGLGWLHTMKQLGLGACLADDMGLGKTIQVIAMLTNIFAIKEEKVLLVVPASLIGNWTAEITKFAPNLKYYVIHPQENKSIEAPVDDGGGIYITTYGMLVRLEWLLQAEWDLLILDEAQAIKNPGTKQTKIVKQLKTRSRIAMTGTPVENRLADLWSLFDFLNKGLLGSAKEFTVFTKKMQESPDGYAKLKQVVAPFILRRLKTDKKVIADLPEKIEMKTYATLTKKQAALYGAAVTELQSRLESAEGIGRKGLVLAALLKFKQLCNHPDQYLGQAGYLENESGKYARLREICETIAAKRERVLVFTQFKEITAPLAAFLSTVFHHEGLILHGETPVAKRKEIVAKFQGHEYIPFMVLSIKAGGVGLNLTAANHVVHFDRWWNPAVENQATDRVFRIGQQRNVVVHKFITQGTVEEKIDQMIEAKTKMAQDILPDVNESWITEMDNRQLMELFRLG
jgi:superfamily II DNA or RNA helicase